MTNNKDFAGAQSATEDVSAGSIASDAASHAAPTPGPWGIERFPDAIEVVGRGEMAAVVAIVGARAGSPTAEADAHLIAAAPELLEALKELIDASTASDNELWQTYGDKSARASALMGLGGVARTKAKAAIAKAEGRS